MAKFLLCSSRLKNLSGEGTHRISVKNNVGGSWGWHRLSGLAVSPFSHKTTWGEPYRSLELLPPQGGLTDLMSEDLSDSGYSDLRWQQAALT